MKRMGMEKRGGGHVRLGYLQSCKGGHSSNTKKKKTVTR